LGSTTVFDPKVQKTSDDNWNYYGEYIKNWYPDLTDLLNLAGVEVDYEKEALTHPEPPSVPAPQDFLPDEFGDLFLDYIRKEANECRMSDLFLSLMFLSRKLLEVVTVRVLEVVFPKLVNGKYSERNHMVWYDTDRGRYHSFDTLLSKLKENSEAFHEDEELVKEYMRLVWPFKNETNKHIHLDYKIPDERYINEWRIPRLIGMARRLYRKYCNP
jgi:hypothetical protein